MSKNHAILNQSTDRVAKIRYHMKDFIVVEIGTHVFCAETGKRIEIPNLKYWNVERQEPYFDAYAALKREIGLRNGRTGNL